MRQHVVSDSRLSSIVGGVGRRLGAAALAAGLSLGSSSARAADTAAPTIEHTSPGSCPGAVVGAPPPPCAIEAVIADQSGVFDPTLLVRLHGTSSYDRVPMTPVAGKVDTYQALVPPALANAGVVEYLIEAFDVQGNGPARAGSENAPLQLQPVAVITPAPKETTPPTTPADDGDTTALVLGVVAGGGAALVVGAGIAVAVYALRPPGISTVTVKVEGPSPLSAAVTP